MKNQERDRLIELIKIIEKHPEKTCPRYDLDCEGCEFLKENDTCDLYARKADYLLKNGVIVPPCKVGDMVYFINGRYEKQGRKKVYIEFVDKGEVDNIVIGGKGVPQVDVCNGENEWITFDSEDDFGKTVFLTKEQAEQALEERKDEGK